jgi:putative glutathione S-transferase
LAQSDGHGSFDCDGCIPDIIHGATNVREVYERTGYTGSKFSVPVLWDKKASVIVNNESSEIIRCFNTAFNAFSTRPELDLYPEALRPAIDDTNAWIYTSINDGVYKCGFAKSQAAYDDASALLFAGLDRMEALLKDQRWAVFCC